MIKLKPTKSKTEDQSKSEFTELLFFIAINVIFVSISTYQTYVGYQADVAGNQFMAIAIAIAVGILFLAMNFEIRRRRINGEPHYWQLLLYLLPFGIAFFGNFNAFYANQTRDVLLREEITSYRSHLEQTYDEATQALIASANINSFEQDYNTHLNALKNEFNRPPAGWGRAAESRWIELVRFLNSQGGNINANVTGNTSGSIRYNRALAAADDEFENLKNAKKNAIGPTQTSINARFEKVKNNIDKLVSQNPPTYNASMLDDMISAENFIRSQSTALLLRDDFFSNPALKPSSANEIGTIKHTVERAFIKGENPSATLFALFISLVIDLAALMYILVFVRYNVQNTSLRGRTSHGPKRL